MSGIIEEKMNEVKKAYEHAMQDVLKFRAHAIKELNEYQESAYKHLKDELDRQFDNINSKVEIEKQNAVNKKKRVEQDIMRDINRQKTANAHIRRESTYPTYIPHRETPRQTREEPYMPPPRGAPYTPTPRKAPHIPHSETNIDFKEEYEITEPGYYYRVLGLAPGSSQQEVRKAYRKKMLIYHPDRSFSDGYSPKNSAYMIKVVSQAKKVLGDENNTDKKERYDTYGNRNNWIKDVKGALKNKCYNLSAYNPYRVIQ